ncbi:hypothetical protein FB45DRAFT_933457 [Roridomyces roridus]|uniref:Uncharacterized protein n=1 Tax=Roridomyces roridus TaxID=1738132 RepID=A0AAD7BCI1_9AGAR|nr:hypothetical protein FB45DRAFT_933457 [Roridomyces roridus]
MDISSVRNDSKSVQDGSDSYLQGSSFFNRAQHFEVSGGTFTHITNIHHKSSPDFRMIPVGDIDVRDTIAYHRPHQMRFVKQIYSARIDSRESPMTVALYIGEDAEEEWRREISKYSHLRHPNLMQLYAAATSGGICATIFHDELIPLNHVYQTYSRHSPLWAVYVLFCSNSLCHDASRTHEENFPAA